MSLDLNTILKDWPHQNGSIKVRKIVGLDGREKLQLRIDLGVLQMELHGRPDGVRPYGCESLLDYHQRRAAVSRSKEEDYDLTPEECTELQQEGIQYYPRYLSLFQINEFAGVVRDTQRNLDLFDFVTAHSGREELAWSLQQFRPYVLMMNTRAKASILLGPANSLKRCARSSVAATLSSNSFSGRISPNWRLKAQKSRSSRNGCRKSAPNVRSRNWK